MSDYACEHFYAAAKIITWVSHGIFIDDTTELNEWEEQVIPMLLDAGLLKPRDKEQGHSPYAITWKGLQFISYYNYLTKERLFDKNKLHDDTHRQLFLFF